MQNIESRIRPSKKTHDGYNIVKDEAGEKDLSGQLSHVNISTHHAGANMPEKQIASERDSSPAMNKVLPPTSIDCGE